MANNWTEEQREVIESREGSLLVSAAAGSGKTAVLVERIIRMITDPEHPVSIDRMLVMTFTRAAAAEIRERIRNAILKKLKEDPENGRLEKQAILSEYAQITTIDSFCKWMLQENFDRADIDPSFRIVSEDELVLVRSDVMKAMLEEYYASGREGFRCFADRFVSGKTDAEIEDLVWSVCTVALSTPWPEEWLENCRQELLSETEETVRESSWMKWLLSDAGRQAREWNALLLKALELSRDPEGPQAYEASLSEDYHYTERLMAASGDFGSMRNTAAGYDFPALGRVKRKTALSEQVKNIRDKVKKAALEMRDLYFSFTLEEAAGRQKEWLLVLLELSLDFLRRFGEAKREKNVLDFGDLEHLVLRLLSQGDGDHSPGPAADEAARQFDWILVDEYQDSNQVQEELVNYISRKRFGTPNVIMVGDVKQSIYRFRLAKPELFMQKYKDFGISGPERKIELHRNFRSRDEVLGTVNDIFRRVMWGSVGRVDYTEAAALYTGRMLKKGEEEGDFRSELLLVDCGDDAPGAEDADAGKKELEAALIAARIRELTDPETGLRVTDKQTEKLRPARYGDIVILLRAVSGWAEEFAEVLIRLGIPAVTESRTGYFDTREVKTVMDFLSVIDNPLNDIPLTASLLSPFGGLLETELAAAMAEDKQDASRDRDSSFYMVLKRYLERHREDPDGISEKLTAFFSLHRELRDASSFLSMPDLLSLLYEKTGWYRYASAMPGGEVRKANLDMLVEKAKDMEKTGYRGIFQFVRYVEKLQKAGTSLGEASVPSPEGNSVRIMSIHKSKGLEFPIVFAAGLAKKFNSMDSRSRFLLDADEGIAGDDIRYETREFWPTLKKNVMKRRAKLDFLGEEIRMLYVALTRAKDKLILTGAVKEPQALLAKWEAMAGDPGPVPGCVTESAGCMLDWVFMAMADGSVRLESRVYNPGDLTCGEAGEMRKKENAGRLLREMDMSRIYDEKTARILAKSYAFTYPWEAETRMNIKLSVSELKKEHMESPEILSSEEEQSERLFGPTGVTAGAAAGTAFHRVMELIPFSGISGTEDIREKLEGFLEEGRIDEETFSLIRPKNVLDFLQSDLGKRAAAAEQRGKLRKEQQFVIGIPAREAGRGDSDERILIQGIIDAFFEEGGELVLYDYKTDRVNSPEELLERYKVQLDYYKRALEQITGIRVKESWLWSIRFGAIFC